MILGQDSPCIKLLVMLATDRTDSFEKLKSYVVELASFVYLFQDGREEQLGRFCGFVWFFEYSHTTEWYILF